MQLKAILIKFKNREEELFDKSYSDWDNTIKERLNGYNSKIPVFDLK